MELAKLAKILNVKNLFIPVLWQFTEIAKKNL